MKLVFVVLVLSLSVLAENETKISQQVPLWLFTTPNLNMEICLHPVTKAML